MNRRALLAGLALVVLRRGRPGVLLAGGGGDATPSPRASERTRGVRRGRAGHRRPQHLRRPGPGRGPLLLLPRAGGDRQRRGRPARRRRGHHPGRVRRPVRLPARQLPRDHAHGRARVRAAHPPDAGEADGQPAARPTTRAARPATPTASSRRSRPRSRRPGPTVANQAVRRVRDALPALQLHARLRPRVHAPQQRQDRARAADVRAARHRRRARLLPGHLPRLLVRGERHRRHRRSPRTPSPTRASCAAPSPRSSCAPCWYRAFVETATGTRMESGGGRSRAVRRPRGPAAPGVRDRRERDRPARPAQPARGLRLAAGRHRRRRLHPRHQGPEPAPVPGRDAGRPDQGLQAVRRLDGARRATAGWARRSAWSATASSATTGCPKLPDGRARARRAWRA